MADGGSAAGRIGDVGSRPAGQAAHGLAPDTPEPVVRLVREIAVQFEHRPPDDAAAVIAAHLTRFWDPRMRRRLVDAVATGVAVDPVTARVAELLAVGSPGL